MSATDAMLIATSTLEALLGSADLAIRPAAGVAA
jgi:hypothetical protein